MSPIAMSVLLLVTLGAFAYSARRRWRLMLIGAPANRTDQLSRRICLTLRQALGQSKLGRNPLAGFAHKAIFFGFMVLLLRALILFARGYTDDPAFGFWLFDDGTVLGNIYALLKDIFIVLVILGVAAFLYFRLIVKLPRMSQSREAIGILAIILLIVLSDVLYDAASHVTHAQAVSATAVEFNPWQPLGSIIAPAINSLPDTAVNILRHAGFWIHVSLILIFLNLLPYSKHFHVITAIPNVFLQDLDPPGRMRPIKDIEGRIEREETLGIRRINEFSWKAMLDLYSCTECGRCTDQCPAARTGKLLSPKKLTVDLRDYLYSNEQSLVNGADDQPPEDLVPAVIDPEALWACTTCRACEQECPVQISYVDKITDLRRHLVQERGEFPAPLQEAFGGMEAAGNPYSAPEDERMSWAKGLDVPIRAQTDDIDVLFWVGCAPAMDDKAKSIARSLAQLLNHAGIKWACLGTEERCTGDTARRAGNEYLFQMMAEMNIEVLDGYNSKTILTACPHCYNTLKHEYPDFGGNYDVHHHSDYLARLVREGRLKPTNSVEARVAYHDSCYLGRYNEIYESPRELLRSIPGVELVEPEATRDRGMCCGAGGAQMFKEEEPGEQRVSAARTLQLQQTNAQVIASACPFCKRMLTDGLDSDQEPTNGQSQPPIRQLDIAEVLLESVQANDER